MTPADAHINLLLAIDPIIRVWVTRDQPCGDPLGTEHNLHKQSLTQLVRERGLDAALDLPETRRLLCNIGGHA